ncbi:MAG: hypothetical protein JSW62_01625 [Thermoplasmatales archaeon]|nr:MAG: hypothetical protein JSW62_01625 [Thermoplasmatales archaeon]
MKTKEIITLIGFSGFMTIFITICQDTVDIALAVVTFLIITCALFITFFEEDNSKRR